MGIVGLPPIVRFIGIEFAIECSHSGIGFLTVLVIIQVLRVEQEFVFALRIGRIVVPCPLIIVGPLCQQHVKLHVGSFFLWNQTIVYHFILYARAYGIVFVPVSYTHLDVYKRQGIMNKKQILDKGNFFPSPFAAMNTQLLFHGSEHLEMLVQQLLVCGQLGIGRCV